MGLTTFELIRASLTAHAWRAASPEWRAGFMAGIAAATKDRTPAVRVVSIDGLTIEERGT